MIATTDGRTTAITEAKSGIELPPEVVTRGGTLKVGLMGEGLAAGVMIGVLAFSVLMVKPGKVQLVTVRTTINATKTIALYLNFDMVTFPSQYFLHYIISARSDIKKSPSSIGEGDQGKLLTRIFI